MPAAHQHQHQHQLQLQLQQQFQQQLQQQPQYQHKLPEGARPMPHQDSFDPMHAHVAPHSHAHGGFGSTHSLQYAQHAQHGQMYETMLHPGMMNSYGQEPVPHML
jgi:hypothetical protein